MTNRRRCIKRFTPCQPDRVAFFGFEPYRLALINLDDALRYRLKWRCWSGTSQEAGPLAIGCHPARKTLAIPHWGAHFAATVASSSSTADFTTEATLGRKEEEVAHTATHRESASFSSPNLPVRSIPKLPLCKPRVKSAKCWYPVPTLGENKGQAQNPPLRFPHFQGISQLSQRV